MPEIKITAEVRSLKHPITEEVVSKSISLLNIVFNQPEFKESLCAQTFVGTNRPDLSNADGFIPGESVFNEFYSNKEYEIVLKVKKLKNIWERKFSKTKGKTTLKGREIVTYNWWLKNKTEKELIINYASYIGHELFHTSYFKFVHDPEYVSVDFVNDKDVIYKIDNILEELIRKIYD